MDEAEVRQLASMYSLVAQMESIKIHVAGMKTSNEFAMMNRQPILFEWDAFSDAQDEMVKVANRLADEI